MCKIRDISIGASKKFFMQDFAGLFLLGLDKYINDYATYYTYIPHDQRYHEEV